MKFDICVIVSAYNQSSTLQPILNALKAEAETQGIKTQIIIADDGSSEDEVQKTLNLVTSFNEKANLHIQHVWQQDLGFRLATSRNNGLKKASAEIIVFLDGDCVPQPDFLKYHAEAHNAHNGSLICVGHRSFKHPAITIENAKTDADRKVLDRLHFLEEMEEDTIRQKYQTSTSWRAVLGRNFSFRQSVPPVYFDDRLYGWGAEDFDFAIQLQKLMNYSIAYEDRATVAQYDDLSESNNPLEQMSQKKIAYVQINYLLLMKKYEQLPETFIELAKFLAYYTIPFDFDGQEYHLNEDKKQKLLSEFSAGLPIEHSQATELYQSTLRNLELFFANNKQIIVHPAMLYLTGEGYDFQPRPGAE